MIPFAGHDPSENARVIRKGVPAYELFQLGYDTMRIAERLGITEAKALKLINVQRSELINKPNPYGVE